MVPQRAIESVLAAYISAEPKTASLRPYRAPVDNTLFPPEVAACLRICPASRSRLSKLADPPRAAPLDHDRSPKSRKRPAAATVTARIPRNTLRKYPSTVRSDPAIRKYTVYCIHLCSSIVFCHFSSSYPARRDYSSSTAGPEPASDSTPILDTLLSSWVMVQLPSKITPSSMNKLGVLTFPNSFPGR